AAEPVSVQPEPGPTKGSGIGMLLGIVAVLLAVSGVIVAYRAGWLSAPDLTATPGQTAANATNKPAQQAPGKGPAGKAVPEKTETKKEKGPGEIDPPPVDPDKKELEKKGPEKKKPDEGETKKVDPKPPVVKREFKGTEHVLSAIRDHLTGLPEADRKFQ